MLKTLKNENVDSIIDLIAKDEDCNIFIFAVGYEERSIFLYEEYFKETNSLKICFLFDDYQKYPIAVRNKKIIDQGKIQPISVNYRDCELVLNSINTQIASIRDSFENLNIHIDYSSMPRSWYCRIPHSFGKRISQNDRIYFWYSEGVYPKKAENWPSAGVEEVQVFAGKPSTNPMNNRSHIFGIGFDNLRSQAIYSVLDPSFLVVTLSHPADYEKMREVVQRKNKELLSSAAFYSSLPTNDFLFSISKLYEIVNELHFDGDVILVPDGPKPQILMYSLIPNLFNNDGIICLHVKRHPKFYKALNVKARGRVFGFSYSSCDLAN